MSALAFGTMIELPWDLRSSLPPQEEAYAPLQGGGQRKVKNPSFEAHLSFLKT